MKNKFQFNRYTLAFASLLLCAVFSACNNEYKVRISCFIPTENILSPNRIDTVLTLDKTTFDAISNTTYRDGISGAICGCKSLK